MGIGSSSGAYYNSEFHRSIGFNSNDSAVSDPADLGLSSLDNNNMTPQFMQNNIQSGKDLQNVEEKELGGIPVKDQMPFPDNRNPDTDFASRFPNTKGGILNDLKKPVDPTPPLVRRISNDLVPPNKIGITDQDIDKAIGVGLASSTGAETVGKAALKYGKEVFEGLNHGEAFEKFMNKYTERPEPGFTYDKVKQGFTTSKGRFVSREEAFDLANKADQIQNKGLGDSIANFGLLSEDLK